MDDADPDLFEQEVSNHIMWKYDSIEFTPKDKVKMFLTGVASLFYPIQVSLPKKYIPLRRRVDLSRRQKTNISLASIWKKEQEFLENIVSGAISNQEISKEQALSGLDYLTQQYNQCKQEFYEN
ncbi:hypothetical protein KY334_03850 [Candidatus Woesearchaeota archaeon]|nr:hypothetical protein [Candidatus Woesearchaeota archaeon]